MSKGVDEGGREGASEKGSEREREGGAWGKGGREGREGMEGKGGRKRLELGLRDRRELCTEGCPS